MIRLSTLGPTELRRESGEDLRPVLVQPKRLGLLVYLAVEAPDRFVRRDSLLALFWPEFDQSQARQALRSALYFLRQHLGDGVVVSRGADEVGVDTTILTTDAVAFREAAERQDADAALALYRGDFLAGLHLADGSPDLDQWTSRTRVELRRQAAGLAWATAERHERDRNPAGAAQWGRRAYEIEADDEASLRRLMELLYRLGDTGGAIRSFEEFATRLQSELGVAPSPASRSLAAQIRIRRPTGPAATLDPGPDYPIQPTVARPAPLTTASPATTPSGSAAPTPDPSSPTLAAPVRGPDPAERPRVASRRSGTRRVAALAVGVVMVGGALVAAALIDREAPIPKVEGPIAVAVLRNETGDSALSIWGRYAGDWITQGLQAAGRLPVVPWPSALRASRLADSTGRGQDSVDPVVLLQRETGARTVITGSYYRVNDSIRFRADINLAGTGSILWSVPTIAAAPDSVEAAIRELRARLLGGIGVSTDPRFAGNPLLGRQPPRFTAFVAYERGTALFDVSKYSEAVVEYERALGLDSAFVPPILAALTARWNMRHYEQVDSLVSLLAARRASLTEPQELKLRGVEARMRGDGQAMLELQRRAATVAPSTSNWYNLALFALMMGKPREAIRSLENLSENESYKNRWAPYWIYLAHAHHLVGQYEDALAAVGELRRRFPNRTVGLVLEVASLAGQGRVDAIDSVIVADVSSPNTYWSTAGALIVAGEELTVHGHATEGLAMYQRAVDWLEEQLRADPRNRNHRDWLAAVLYQMGRWEEAGRLAEELAVEWPNRLSFRLLPALVAARLGDTVLAIQKLGHPAPADLGWYAGSRARIAAIAGDADRAVALLREALDRSVPSFHWAHSDWWVDFAPLRADPRITRLLLEGLD